MGPLAALYHRQYEKSAPRQASSQPAALPVKVTGGVFPIPVVVNGISSGNPTSAPALGRSAGPDFARWTVIDATGAADTVVIRIQDRKSTRLNSSHLGISYAVFCLKKKKNNIIE